MTNKKEKFLLIEKSSLPEVFLKVMQVKEGIRDKIYPSINQAVKEVGISRSAYYKYHNSVYNYQDIDHNSLEIFTLFIELDLISVVQIIKQFDQKTIQVLSIQQSLVIKGISSVQIVCNQMGKDVIDSIIKKLQRKNGVIQILHQAIND